jgi:hypothetical protein
MVGMPAVIRSPIEDALRIASKRHQLSEACAFLRRQAQVFEKRAKATVATLRDLKLKFRPLWLTLPIQHQIKICVGSDAYGGDISCNAR